ncbi:MAG TPA: 3'-5' exonuclease, partial [Chitinophagaceae bacterium]
MASFPLNNILFLDIETVPQFPDYFSLPEDWRQLWDTKSVSLLKYHEDQTNETLYPRAGIYAEFGKIVCISCGVLQGNGGQRKIIIKSFASDDEKIVLQRFIDMLN